MTLTDQQIDRACDGMDASADEREALRQQAKAGNTNARFAVYALAKRQRQECQQALPLD